MSFHPFALMYSLPKTAFRVFIGWTNGESFGHYAITVRRLSGNIYLLGPIHAVDPI